MMTHVTSINKAGAQWVPLPRSTDAIGAVLRRAYAQPPLPEEMVQLLHRLDRAGVAH